MKILALDCSAKAVSAAIADENKLIAEGFLNIPLTHSETLMPIVEQLLKNSRLDLKDIDAFAVTAGPGSFTGIRIGISAVKGMAFASQKPVYPYSTLFAMALGFAGNGFEGLVCALMDARRNQFYNAIFKVKNGKITRITEDDLSSFVEIENKFKKSKEKIILMGDGAELFFELSGKNQKYFMANKELRYQRSSSIAVSAATGEYAPASVSPEALQTVYLRKAQAEREREEKLLK